MITYSLIICNWVHKRIFNKIVYLIQILHQLEFSTKNTFIIKKKVNNWKYKCNPTAKKYAIKINMKNNFNNLFFRLKKINIDMQYYFINIIYVCQIGILHPKYKLLFNLMFMKNII